MIKVLESGTREYRVPDLDGFREWIRDHKSREPRNKVMSAEEAVRRFVADDDYLCYETGYIMRGPAALLREVARQRKKNLWLGAKFTYFDSALLAAAGCVSKIDVGFVGYGKSLYRAVQDGEIKTIEWTNNAITMRLLAGAMGLPFIAARYVGGTDVLPNSAAKLIEDPFTSLPVTILPALNPDVSLIHAQQCDEFGNARIFGPSISPVELATASRKVIVSTERIIDSEETRSNPGWTTIPFYFVDAVVETPFGAHPGSVPGYYASDTQHIIELATAADADRMDEYIEKYVFGVQAHQQYLEKIGLAKLLKLQQHEVIKEGYPR